MTREAPFPPAGPIASNCADARMMLGAHAVGALEPWEQEAVAEHVAACPDCRAELSRHHRAATALGLGVAPIPPPDALRRRLLAEIADAQPATAPLVTRAKQPVPLRTAVDGRRWRRASFGLAAAAVLLLMVAAVAGVLLRQAQGARDNALADRREFAEYLSHGGTVTALVPARGASAVVGRGSLIVAPDQPNAAIVVAGLATSGGLRYRVWVERGGARTWLADLELAADGTGYLVFSAPAPLTSYDTVGVALETPGRAAQDLLDAPIRPAS